jgi:eukaryotic-like serine/threonine-protein kinase
MSSDLLHTNAQRRRHAVIVGVDSYRDESIPLLRGCAKDAKDLAALLSMEQFDFDCVTILNSEATRSNIIEQLGSHAYDPEGGDFLLFYFAGHGASLGGYGHLVTTDASQLDPGLSLAHLAQMMEAAGSNYSHVAAILDSCHSGFGITWIGARPIQPADLTREIRTVNESRCLLAACRPEQSAGESVNGGEFTQILVEGLLGDAVDFEGQIHLLGLYQYVSSALEGSAQTPVFRGDISGTVVLGSGFEPRKGAPIKNPELNKIIAKAQSLADNYYHLQLRELSDTEHRAARGARTCEVELAGIVSWFTETVQTSPEISRNPEWSALAQNVREYRQQLATVQKGQHLYYGVTRKHLGAGGFGHVWSVESADGSLLAVKMFNGSDIDDQIKISRFINGYRSMQRLNHPRVVRVREFLDVPLSFSMDLVEGEDLTTAYLDRSDASGILRLIREIAETVDHAHSKEVLHRDIKPGNIIIAYDDSGNPVPYLTDFDLAYHQTQKTMTVVGKAVGGVLEYAAPEQLHQPNTAAARAVTADIYSLAQLVYFIIMGESPGSERIEENSKRLRQRLNDWADDRAGEALLEIYTRCTKREPSQRLQSVRQLINLITEAETYTAAASGTDQIREADFCRRIAHVYAGLGAFQCTDLSAHMESLSGEVGVEVRVLGSSADSDSVNIELEFNALGSAPMSNAKSGSAGRERLNQRLDRALNREFPSARRHPGSRGAFQTYVQLDRVPLTLEGVLRVSKVLGTVVGTIEAQ